MHVILIPGFWLDAASWSETALLLEQAGHHAQPLTLPGLESPDAARAGIGLRDHVAAVVAAIDAAAPERVVLVGHSGGSAIAHAAADARPEAVARVVHVDAAPLGSGQAINDQLPVVDGDIPLPPWEVFDEEDLVDLDDALREAFRARAVPEPRGVAYDPQVLTDERRFAIPVTIIACEFPSALLQGMIAGRHDFVAELARMQDVEYVDLPTGHWPQLTRPADLARVILDAVESA